MTVTTTVIHMSRLQALRECEYTRKTRTCTCYSIETHAMQDDGNGNIGSNDESKYSINITKNFIHSPNTFHSTFSISICSFCFYF